MENNTTSPAPEVTTNQLLDMIGELVALANDMNGENDFTDKEKKTVDHADALVEKARSMPASSLLDLSTMSRAKKYDLAGRIIRDIWSEWCDSGDEKQWQKDHVEEYDSCMSFDELAAEVRGITFKE